jgi:hypothetical protein
MKKAGFLALGALLLSASIVTQAAAGDFTPKLKFSLTNRHIKANPSLKIHLEQDAGEEELAHVTLRVPKGFKLPTDAKLEDGDELGSGEIQIDAGPGCRPEAPNPVKAPLTVPATLTEQDRTDEQADRGVRDVWLLDISGVTQVPLEVTGTPTTGFKLDGDIAKNDSTCPPFVFDLTVNAKSKGGVPILKNPGTTGPRTFKARFTSQDSPATASIKQTIKIIR